MHIEFLEAKRRRYFSLSKHIFLLMTFLSKSFVTDINIQNRWKYFYIKNINNVLFLIVFHNLKARNLNFVSVWCGSDNAVFNKYLNKKSKRAFFKCG